MYHKSPKTHKHVLQTARDVVHDKPQNIYIFEYGRNSFQIEYVDYDAHAYERDQNISAVVT